MPVSVVNPEMAGSVGAPANRAKMKLDSTVLRNRFASLHHPIKCVPVTHCLGTDAVTKQLSPCLAPPAGGMSELRVDDAGVFVDDLAEFGETVPRAAQAARRVLRRAALLPPGVGLFAEQPFPAEVDGLVLGLVTGRLRLLNNLVRLLTG